MQSRDILIQITNEALLAAKKKHLLKEKESIFINLKHPMWDQREQLCSVQTSLMYMTTCDTKNTTQLCSSYVFQIMIE